MRYRRRIWRALGLMILLMPIIGLLWKHLIASKEVIWEIWGLALFLSAIELWLSVIILTSLLGIKKGFGKLIIAIKRPDHHIF